MTVFPNYPYICRPNASENAPNSLPSLAKDADWLKWTD